MTLVLSNEEIESYLRMPECIEAVEDAQREFAALRAANRPRTDLYAPHVRDDAFYVFKSFEGVLPKAGVVALRLNSDVIVMSEYQGKMRKDKQPLANGRWVGLILLFSTTTGEPLAIMPDGVVQRMRVGATSGLAARLMARPNAEVYGLIGTGWQAGGQLMAMAAVRNLREVRAFSPNPEHRAAFADEWSEKLGLHVRAVGSAREAVEGADIVGTATNAIAPLIEPEWLAPGVHLTCVKRSELGERLLSNCARIVVHSHEGPPRNYMVGLRNTSVLAHDPFPLAERLRRGECVSAAEIEGVSRAALEPEHEPQLCDLLTGEIDVLRCGEAPNAFVNNVGMGIQFAAIGNLAYRKGLERGLGHQLPTEWFTEDVHP
jgi:alanine dehydrogenase